MFYKSKKHNSGKTPAESFTERSTVFLYLTAYLCGVMIGSAFLFSGKGEFPKDLLRTDSLFSDPQTYMSRFILLICAIFLLEIILSTSFFGQLTLPFVPMLMGSVIGASVSTFLLKRGYAGISIFLKTLFPVFAISATAILSFSLTGKNLSKTLIQSIAERIRQPVKSYFAKLWILIVVLVVSFALMYLLLTSSHE